MENVYGSEKRLRWIQQHLERGDRILEIGCGTGVGITLPLLREGYDVFGVDVDPASVEVGRRILQGEGLDPQRLLCRDISDLTGPYEVVVVSEVLEHLHDEERTAFLPLVRRLLPVNGRALFTVPNGYGWFEIESWFWRALRLERLFSWKPLRAIVWKVRVVLYGRRYDEWKARPTSLSTSPHVQRFTLRSIRRILEGAGFEVKKAEGSVLVSGPLSDKVWSGCRPFMWLNNRIGRRTGPVAAGFFISCTRRV